MNKELKKAFRATIERWEKIVDDVDCYGRSDCALCDYSHSMGLGCDNCPIFKKTDETKCFDTPWDDFTDDGGANQRKCFKGISVFKEPLY